MVLGQGLSGPAYQSLAFRVLPGALSCRREGVGRGWAACLMSCLEEDLDNLGSKVLLYPVANQYYR